ncbi:biotin carboxylase N-terminal domain-containing protein [uncultured Aeromicrobium sp.]|uniref:ATP-binding protein n=1 Tax=uncultured Aeromicrobium sp. TaxID=337820 RepID=UPI0025DEC8B9|nr:biotin carboxylase N-terminal domain-containing protein [uncultured Aeromicrobium sp.]
MSFSSVLVANRGEIARRIIRACREAGLRSIAVYSDADADAPFVYEADHAVRLGPPPAAESYLSIPAILEAARASGAEAIHPGYGFLSERAAFARAVTDAGLIFIGPSADVIEAMGRKDRAREIAERAGVPVPPRQDPDAIPHDAYPVLVKAAAGGGGKGMHIVWSPEQLGDALATARREAAAAFGDDTLLVERYVESGRHVEVQVFGDAHGNVVHLYERDCSAQRRHQKIVEEAPAPGLDPHVRRTILDASVALCREVGYVGAGTVEFLVADDEAYFLEMNTRLQVEHPVTEEVTGIDLVQWQLAVAAGERLPLRQDDISCRGHAIEARIYAEDPYAGFLPQAGRIEHLVWPEPEARVEAAIDGPGAVGTSYDPMLAKIIVSGADRSAAIDALVDALDETAVLGLTTNAGFVRRLVNSEPFRNGQVHTGWLDDPAAAAEVLRAPEVPDVGWEFAAALLAPRDDGSPFGRLDGWRSAGPVRPLLVPVAGPDGEVRQIRPAGDPVGIIGIRIGPRVLAAVEGHSWEFHAPDGARRAHAALAGAAEVTAPMPGAVVTVEVSEGDRVVDGQRLGTMEAMKMELALVAPHDGVVTQVAVEPGQQVAIGQLLLHVDPSDQADSDS